MPKTTVVQAKSTEETREGEREVELSTAKHWRKGVGGGGGEVPTKIGREGTFKNGEGVGGEEWLQ